LSREPLTPFRCPQTLRVVALHPPAKIPQGGSRRAGCRSSPRGQAWSQGGGPMAKKSTCPITRAQFRKDAKAVKVVIDGKEHDAEVKEFSTGSLGWNINSNITLQVGGVSVPVQVGLNLTIVGSKELPPEPDAPTSSPPAGPGP